jgi:hypothetical protein
VPLIPVGAEEARIAELVERALGQRESIWG